MSKSLHEQPTTEEYEQLWDEIETVYKTSYRCRLHLYADCEKLKGDATAKPSAAYPVGQKDICSVCYGRYKHGDQ